MEGRRCEEPGCSICDFLPFHCARCERYFCLEHRSRFVHHCLSTEDEAKELHHSTSHGGHDGQNVRAMMQSVEDRHKALDQTFSSSATHHRVKQDAGLPAQSAAFANSMQRLDHIQHSTRHNDREKRVGEQTRRMLIKQKAVGNDQLLPESRLYLTLHFEDLPAASSATPGKPSAHTPSPPQPPQEVAYFFCSKSALLGEVLQQVKSRFGQYCLVHRDFRQHHSPASASSAFSNQYSLAITTQDAANWQDWNRTAAVQDLLQSCEDVWLSLVPTAQAVEAQDRLKANLQHRKQQEEAEEAKRQQEEAHSKAGEAEKRSRVPHSFAKGDLAWYFKTPQPTGDETQPHPPLHIHSVEEAEHTQIPLILVKVIGVHHDDFPNIYYTIALVKPVQGLGAHADRLIFHTEKQTDAGHLLVHHAPSAEEQVRQALEELERHILSLGDVFTIRASYNKEEFSNIRISAKSSLAQLRLLLSIYSKVPVPNLKMIYKGVMLKQDNMSVAAAKIAPNSKIVIMGL